MVESTLSAVTENETYRNRSVCEREFQTRDQSKNNMEKAKERKRAGDK